MYLLNASAVFGAGFDIEYCSNLSKIFLDSLLIHLSLVL